ncbi:MAG: alpha/beta fold hydrolase [Cyanobacteria bacterium SBLK]|nr:alpha/beta fold hydrolase [Cyanobacteria bacterium SBLK]
MKIKLPRFRSLFLIRLSAIAAFLFLSGTSLAIYLASNRLLFPKKPALEKRHLQIIQNPQQFGFHLTPFSVKTQDDIRIEAYLIAPSSRISREKSRGTILMLHGISGIKEHNFAIAERFIAAGFYCITYDSRSHGESTGKFVTYGLKEVADASLILDEADLRFGQNLAPFGLFGISLGASVGLQLIPNDSRIQRAIIVSSFANLETLIGELSEKYLSRIGAKLFVRLLFWLTEKRTNLPFHQVSPIASAKAIDIPMMVVHGENDPFTNINHSRQIHEAIPNKNKVWRVVSKGNHHQVLMQGGDELYREMVEFLKP